jgi:putative membrane protein
LKRLKDYLLIFAKGLCMGATEVVNGVSGSTMALILGVYQDFINALRSIDRNAIALIRKGHFQTFWKKINGGFLFTLLAGICISLFTVTQVISYFIQHYFIGITSLLFGLILISGILLLRKINKWSTRHVLMLVVGISINYSLTLLPPLSTPNNGFFALLSGIVAGFSLAFPGISGAFILILVGKYQYIVTSFSPLNLVVIGSFFIGCLAGLWLASRFMYRILTVHYSVTIALLAGLTVGALNKLWPWRKVLEYVTNGQGEQIPAFDESVLPWRYMALTGKDPQVFQAIVMMALGVFIVVLIEKIAAGLKTKI